MTALSSNRDLDIEAKVDIPASHRTHDFLRDIQAPSSNGQVLELHATLRKYKSYIDRLNAQLARYQALMPLVGIEEVREEEYKGRPEEAEEFVMLLSEHPLIQSYEQHIQALEKENWTLKKDLSSMKIQYENLSKEAEGLSHNLLEKTKKVAELIESNNGQGLLEGKGEGLVEIKENFKKEQAALLAEVDLSHQRINKLENEVKIQTQVSSELADKSKGLNARIFELQSLAETLAHERDISDKKLASRTEDLKNCLTERDELATIKSKIEGDLKLLQKSMEQYKSAYEEQETRKANEIALLEKELHEKELAIKDQKTKLFVQERELDDLRDINRKLQRDLDQTKNDFAQMLKIMEDNETKIALFDDKEKALKALEADCRRKMDDAKLLEEELKNKEKQHQRQMAALEQQWKDELEQRQKKFDSLLGMTRDTNKALLEKREDELSSANERIYRLQSTLDKVQSDYKVTEEEKVKLMATLTTLQKEANEKTMGLESKLRETVRRELEEKQRLQIQLEDTLHVLTKTEERAKECEGALKTVKLQLDTVGKKSEILDKENRDLRATCTTLADERQAFSKEVERVKKLNQTKMDELEEVYNVKLKALSNEMIQTKEKYKTGEEKLYHLLKQQEAMADKWKTEHQNSVKYFERIIGDLNTQVKTLRKENATMKASKGYEDSNIIIKDKSVKL